MVLYESSKVVHGRPYRNKSGRHVGAFCHFKPTHSAKSMEEWDVVLRKARANMANNVARVSYRAMPSVEPDEPVFTEVEYGHGSSGSYGKKASKSKSASSNGATSVKFVNKSNKPV